MPKQKYTLEMAQQRAKEYGGKCLSEKYSAREEMKWFCGTCNKDFILIGNKVMSGNRWCQNCAKIRKSMKKRSTIEEMKQLAISKNGICLSEEYIVGEKLHWKCNVCGHDWWAHGGRIKSRGDWCRKCNGTLNKSPPTKHTIEEAHEIALKNGGKCLSVEFTDMRSKLSWQCGNCGYVWDAKLGHILDGTWCVKCSHSKYIIEDFKKYAEEHNGKCLSEKYVYHKNIIFKCNICNNIWETDGPITLRTNAWCTPCSYKIRAEKLKNTIEDIRFLANKNNCECLSTQYIRNKEKLDWKCNICNYTWSTILVSVTKHNIWCPKCDNRLPKSLLTINDMQIFAKSKGGKCLSTTYDPKLKLEWQCYYGHTWFAKQGNIRAKDGWCPECNKRLGEKVCKYFFETLFANKFITCRPDFLKNPKTGYNLELDGYCSELGIAFEHHGKQHYEAGNWKMTTDDFKYLKYRDKTKKKLCKLAGVKLIIIPQVFQLTQFKNLQKIIEKQCLKLNIILPINFQLLNLSALSYKNLIKEIK